MDEKPINILLLEDDPLDTELFKLRLAGASSGDASLFSVEGTSRLKAALERLEKGNIDVIVTDLTVPDSDGLKTVLSLKEKAERIPIVVLTSMINDQLALEMAKHGVQDYLVKTELGQASLLRTIQYAVERYRLAAEVDHVKSELERLILLDPLTELLNRRGFEKTLSRELAWTRRNHSSLLAILLDIDNFKKINDTWGHAAGDAVLKEVASNLTKSLRATDYISRIGGDEFFILLPGAQLEDGLKIAEKIKLRISEILISFNSERIPVTASFGVIQVTDPMTSIDPLLCKADPLLAKSKANGKNRVTLESVCNQKTVSNL